MKIKYFNKINKFDEVTKFRLYNAFFWSYCSNLIIPLLIDLKGEYLVAWVISLFMIAEQLSLKTNRYLTEKFTISELYKIGVFLHILFTLMTLLFFYNKLYMIIADSIIAILDYAVFSALSIKLNNYLVDNHPKSNNDFQIVRNSIWVDGVLMGLGTSTLIMYFFSPEILIFVFIGVNTLFNLYMLNNFNIYYRLIDLKNP